jgi:hypothetical protein
MTGFLGFGLGFDFDLITLIEIASAIAVVLYAIYLGSSIGIFRKSR